MRACCLTGPPLCIPALDHVPCMSCGGGAPMLLSWRMLGGWDRLVSACDGRRGRSPGKYNEALDTN